MTQVILASASESRANILKNAGVPFDIMPARVDEDAIKDSMLATNQPHRVIADALAELKAIRISTANPGALVIGADQVLSFAGELVSKCATLDEARTLLRRLRGRDRPPAPAASAGSRRGSPRGFSRSCRRRSKQCRAFKPLQLKYRSMCLMSETYIL